MPKPPPTSGLQAFAHPFKRTLPCRYAFLWPRRKASRPLSAAFSTSRSCRDEEFQESQQLPRWRATPPRMVAPFRSKPPVENNDFKVNQDPETLDKIYIRVLGRGGDQMLTDEVKWLAVTHKSFDHGRRGYNDRLSFLGRRILELQTSLVIVHGAKVAPGPLTRDHYQREPFRHPALEGLEGLHMTHKQQATDKKRLAQLGERYGLNHVLRWKPKNMTDLEGSGLSAVISQAMCAIVGAVALQKGGEVANNVVRQRILDPVGFQ